MVIKVIEHGNTHRRKRCEKCGCVFEFGKADIKQFMPDDILRVYCPECGAAIGAGALS